MSKISIKTDFLDGEKLYGDDLNNNFKVIQAAYNNNLENYQEVLDEGTASLVKQLQKITADRGWDWNDSTRVSFFRGTTEQIKNKPIVNGQIIYDISTGEMYVDDNGERISTGSGNVVAIQEEEPINLATKIWVTEEDFLGAAVGEVTNSMKGNETDLAPSVNAVKEYVNNKVYVETIGWNNPNSSNAFTEQTITLTDAISNYDYYEILYKGWKGNPYMLSTGKIPTEWGTTLHYFESAVVIVFRTIQIKNGNMVISDAAGTGVSNNYIIPYQVKLYKKEVTE